VEKITEECPSRNCISNNDGMMGPEAEQRIVSTSINTD